MARVVPFSQTTLNSVSFVNDDRRVSDHKQQHATEVAAAVEMAFPAFDANRVRWLEDPKMSKGSYDDMVCRGATPDEVLSRLKDAWEERHSVERELRNKFGERGSK